MPSPKKFDESNPVIKRIGNHVIRKSNDFKMRFNEVEYERLVKISMITGLAITKIISLSCQPCPICGNDHIQITIPLTLLSSKKLNRGGIKNLKKNDNTNEPG